MHISFETLLVLGILGFYLFDSAMLLYFNEFAIVKSSSAWAFACPASRWRIRGKTPYLPNPLTPGNPLFRAAWSPTDSSPPSHAEQEVARLIDAMRCVGIFVTVLLVEMCVAVPLALFILGTGTGLLIVIAASYLTIIAMLVFVYGKRHALRLSEKDVASIAFDSMACPPFAINTVRKICARYAFDFNPVEFARRRFEKEQFRLLVNAIHGRVDEELALVESDSPLDETLKAYRKQLSELAA